MGLFGNFFDFDGDGKSSLFEELLGLQLFGFFDNKKDEPEPVDDEEDDDLDSDEDSDE